MDFVDVVKMLEFSWEFSFHEWYFATHKYVDFALEKLFNDKFSL